MKTGLAFLLVLPLCATAWSHPFSEDSGAQRKPTNRDGFLSFALKQINPEETNYGCRIDQVRNIVIERAIKDFNAWALVLAIVLLVVSFLMLSHQQKDRLRREYIAARLLAGYHNSWTDALRRAEEAIQRHNELVESINGQPLLSPAVNGMSRSGLLAVDNGTNTHDGTAVVADERTRSDLLAQVSTLQQQLKASYERERNLHNQLTKGQRRPPTSPGTDKTVPG